MPQRLIRVRRNNPTLTYEARCRWCGRLVYSVTEEFLARSTTHLPLFGVPHNCPKLDTTQQLLHNGRKPRA
jgi:hypothetical protein